MTRPGDRLRARVRCAFGEALCREVIDPILADLQHEHALLPPERRWRRRLVHMRGIAAALHGLVTVGLANGPQAIGATLGRSYPRRVAYAVGLMSTAAVTVGISGLSLLETGRRSASMFYLLGLLTPSAFPVAAPVGLAVMTALWSERQRKARGTLCISALVVSVLVGWSLNHLVPDANQAFRTAFYADLSRAPSRGATELSFEELLHVSRSREAQVAYLLDHRTGEPPPDFWLHARVALTMTPLVMMLLAFAATTRRSLVRQRLVLAGAAAAFLAWYVLITRDTYAALIEFGTPAWLAAWFPNLLLATAALVMLLPVGVRSRSAPSASDRDR